eukprot:3258585-Prorocentrum_lima.AAC.1
MASCLMVNNFSNSSDKGSPFLLCSLLGKCDSIQPCKSSNLAAISLKEGCSEIDAICWDASTQYS